MQNNGFTFFGQNSNTNPYSLSGGMQFSNGPTLSGSLAGGSSFPYYYQVNATQPIAPNVAITAQATNIPQPNSMLQEHQVSAGVQFTLK